MSAGPLMSTASACTAGAIHERQLDADLLLLQRAAAASHQRGQLVEAVRVAAAVALAGAGVIITLVDAGGTVVSVAGFFWFIISAFLLKGLAGRTAREGALLEEMFDTALFRMPWRATVAGDPLPEPDIRSLARKLPAGSAKDKRITDGWYDPTVGVHHPDDVFIAQEQNLAWDARLRRRYSNLVPATATVWAAIGLILGLVVANTTLLNTILSFYVPSLAVYQIAYEIWSGQRKVADEREQLARIVNTELRGGQPGEIPEVEWKRLRDVARDVQDGVLRTRLDTTRVPEWLYRHFRDDDEHNFGDTAEGHRARLADDAAST